MHKKNNQPNTQKTTNEAKKEKKMKVFIYFMAYKKIHNMYYNMLDNNYITLKVATRTCFDALTYFEHVQGN
jgi:hypothetical protein